MPNLKAKIDGHNKKIIENSPPLKSKILFLLKIFCCSGKYENLKGICQTNFRQRYANHKKIFKCGKNKKDTKLSTDY